MLNDLPIERVLPALRFCQVEAHLSQEKLASRAGYSTSAVSRRLAGETPLTLGDLETLSKALGMTVTVSFEPTEQPSTAAA